MIKAQPARSGKSGWAAAALVVLALLAGLGYWAVINRDSPARNFKQSRSTAAPAPATAPPVGAAPALPAAATAAAKASTAPPQPVRRAPAPRPAARQAAARTPPVHATSARTGSSGAVRIEVAADVVDVPYGETRAYVTVHRSGSVRGPAVFKWWTEAGTGTPGVDFEPVMPHSARIEDGSSETELPIPVYATSRAAPKSFYVVINQDDSGPAVGARDRSLVTLLPRS